MKVFMLSFKVNGIKNIEKEIEIKERAIHRITLHISNDFNLRCKYCYANGGNYNLHRHLMTKETAKDFYDFCINNFHHIEKIVFLEENHVLMLMS